MIRLIGIDPGFASLGFAVVEVSSDFRRSVVRDSDNKPMMGVLETEKSDKKRAVKATDDNLRRTREMVRMLLPILAGQQIRAICAESMSFPRNSSASNKVGICWGIIGTLAEMMNLPIVQSSPQDIKKHVCGRRDASKEEIQEVMAKRFSLDLDSFLKSKREHCFDALGAVEAAMDSEIVRLACKMARTE